MKRALPYLFVICLLLGIHGALVATGISPVLKGELGDTDSYMRLIRVELLATDIGSWYDSSILRMNAPYGDELNWTRPLDVLILAGALPLVAYGGYDWHQAVFLAGSWLPPVLHILMVLLLAWAAAPLIPSVARPVLALLAGTLPIMLAYNMAGRPDQQTLLLIGLLGMIGWATRGLLEETSHPVRAGLYAGLCAGFALWVTVEAQFAFVILVALLGMLWVERGNERILQLLEGLALGFFVMVSVGMLAERGHDWHSIRELDKISLSHALGAAVNVGLWGFLVATARHAPPVGRLILSLLWGALAAGGLLFFAPELLRGPAGDIDPRVMREFFLQIREMRPLWPVDAQEAGLMLLWLAVPLTGIPLWLLLRPAKLMPWLPVAGLTMAFTALALLHARFAQVAAPLGCILLVHAASRLLGQGTRCWRLAPVAILLIGPLIAGFVVIAALPAPAAPPRCSIATIRSELAALEPGIIMAPLNQGPELLYFTRHSVVAGPYHRNRDGLLDSFDFFGTADDAAARAILRRRGVRYVLACPDSSVPPLARQQALARGQAPGWLEPVSLPESQELRLYRVK